MIPGEASILYDQDDIDRVLSSDLSKPTSTSPVALVSSDIEVFPTDISTMVMRYYKLPQGLNPTSGAKSVDQPKFGYSTAVAGVEAGVLLDAIGPDIFTFTELVQLIRQHTGSRCNLIHLPPTIPLLLAQVIGLFVGDVVLTHDEVRGLMSDLLISDQAPSGKTRLSDWLHQNKGWVGKQYASELSRHYRINPTIN